MTTPETRSGELEPLVLSFDDEAAAASQESSRLEPESRELSAYRFDSDYETLAGLGNSASLKSSTAHDFDIGDRTLVGIGPLDSEIRPESAPIPHSEPPGPIVISEDVNEANVRQPLKKRRSWQPALLALFVVGAAVTLWRGVPAQPPTLGLHAVAIGVKPRHSASSADQPQLQPIAASSAGGTTFATTIIPFPKASEHGTAWATAPREKAHESELPLAKMKSRGAEELGAIDVTSNPPSSLVLDGRPLGRSPRLVQLPSGPHTVLFVHPERGRMSVTVNVRAGHTTNASADF